MLWGFFAVVKEKKTQKSRCFLYRKIKAIESVDVNEFLFICEPFHLITFAQFFLLYRELQREDFVAQVASN